MSWSQVLKVSVACTLFAAGTVGGVSVSTAAWVQQKANPTNAVAGATVGNPSAATASATSVNCNPVTINWSAGAAPADDYKVEKSVNGGGWVSVTASTSGAITASDTTGYVNSTVQYRITSLRAGTSWVGGTPATTNTLRCGVMDLALTNPCSSTVLTWTAAAAATTYDVYYSTTGGAPWTLVQADVAAVTYTSAVQHVNGSNVTYHVVPGIGAGGNGSISNLVTQASWQDFRVTNVSATNGGTSGTIGAGDKLIVTFSKAVATGTVTDTNVRTRRGVGNQGLDIGGATTPGQIGTIAQSSNIYGAIRTLTGTVAWTGTNTIWTWTWGSLTTSQGAVLASPPTMTWSAGTAVRCAADNSQLKIATNPTFDGTW